MLLGLTCNGEMPVSSALLFLISVKRSFLSSSFSSLLFPPFKKVYFFSFLFFFFLFFPMSHLPSHCQFPAQGINSHWWMYESPIMVLVILECSYPPLIGNSHSYSLPLQDSLLNNFKPLHFILLSSLTYKHGMSEIFFRLFIWILKHVSNVQLPLNFSFHGFCVY